MEFFHSRTEIFYLTSFNRELSVDQEKRRKMIDWIMNYISSLHSVDLRCVGVSPSDCMIETIHKRDEKCVLNFQKDFDCKYLINAIMLLTRHLMDLVYLVRILFCLTFLCKKKFRINLWSFNGYSTFCKMQHSFCQKSGFR